MIPRAITPADRAAMADALRAMRFSGMRMAEMVSLSRQNPATIKRLVRVPRQIVRVR